MDLRTILLLTMPAAVLALLPALRRQRGILRHAGRAAVNTAAGLAALLILRAVGGEAAWVPETDWINLAAITVLGVPGIGMIYLVRCVLFR